MTPDFEPEAVVLSNNLCKWYVSGLIQICLLLCFILSIAGRWHYRGLGCDIEDIVSGDGGGLVHSVGHSVCCVQKNEDLVSFPCFDSPNSFVLHFM